MGTFCVHFASDVIYMPGHPKGERSIHELVVAADDADQAKLHAIRVTRGTALVTRVDEVVPAS